MKVFYTLCFVFAIVCTQAQFSLDWTSTTHLNLMHVQKMVVDPSGSSYVLINYTPNNDDQLMDHRFQSKYYSEASSVVKLDSNGKKIWHQTMLTEANEYNQFVWSHIYFKDLAVSDDGQKMVVLGQANGKVKLTSGNEKIHHGELPESSGDKKQQFLLICNTSGELLKEVMIGGEFAYNEQLDKVFFDREGNLYLIKAYKGTVSFDSKKVSSDFQDDETIGVFKFDAKGNFKGQLINWKQSSLNHNDISTHHYINSLSLIFDENNDLYLYGGYTGHLVLDKETVLTSTSRYEDTRAGFLAKYSSQMKLDWHYKFAGKTGGGEIRKMISDKDNNVYLAGDFSTMMSIFKGTTANIQTDVPTISHSGVGLFYGKISSEGDLQFVKFHRQDKHYTSSAVSELWRDSRGLIHILGIYNDSLAIHGLEPKVFGGMRVDTSVFEYNGKMLTSYHEKYFKDVYHLTFKEDTPVDLEKVFKSNQQGGMDYAFRFPSYMNGHLYFVSPPLDLKIKVNGDGDQLIDHQRSEGLLVARLSWKEQDLLLVDATDEIEVPNDSSAVITQIPLSDTLKDTVNLSSNESITEEENIETTESIEITAFPNPFRNELNVKVINAPTYFEVYLYNGLGQLILSQVHSTEGGEYQFGCLLGDLSAGNYYLMIKAENYVKTMPLIKTL